MIPFSSWVRGLIASCAKTHETNNFTQPQNIKNGITIDSDSLSDGYKGYIKFTNNGDVAGVYGHVSATGTKSVILKAGSKALVVLFLNVVTSLRTQSTGLLASVAALTALWSASAGVTAIQKGLKKITPGVEKSVWDKPIALLCTFLIIILIPAFLVFNLLGDSLVGLLHSFSAHFGFEEITAKIIYLIRCSGVVSAAAAVVLILILYTLLPGGKRPLKEQIPGAVFTSLGWLIFTEAFTRFVPLFWKSSVYGSLASLFLTITWVKVSVMILFLGNALNAAWKEEHV